MAAGGAFPTLLADAAKGIAMHRACAAVFTGVWQAAAVSGCETKKVKLKKEQEQEQEQAELPPYSKLLGVCSHHYNVGNAVFRSSASKEFTKTISETKNSRKTQHNRHKLTHCTSVSLPAGTALTQEPVTTFMAGPSVLTGGAVTLALF